MFVESIIQHYFQFFSHENSQESKEKIQESAATKICIGHYICT